MKLKIFRVGGKAGSILYDGADASGFHLDAGKTYIYPTNYPVRQYQATMVKTALFQNTMVSLPTGIKILKSCQVTVPISFFFNLFILYELSLSALLKTMHFYYYE